MTWKRFFTCCCCPRRSKPRKSTPVHVEVEQQEPALVVVQVQEPIKQEEPVQPSVDEETVRDNQRINNVTSTAQNPSGEQTQHQKVMAAKTKDELDQLLFGQSLGR